jgi:integral membrane sensor domain MASE1
MAVTTKTAAVSVGAFLALMVIYMVASHVAQLSNTSKQLHGSLTWLLSIPPNITMIVEC